MSYYHVSQAKPPMGSDIFHIELTKDDCNKINWLRKQMHWEDKTNHEILQIALGRYYGIQWKKHEEHMRWLED